MNQDTQNIIALTMVPGLGPKSILRLIKHTSGTGELFLLGKEKLSKISGRNIEMGSKVFSIRQSKEFIDELRFISEEGIRAISILDADYPELLKNIYDPPPVIFVKGSLKDLNRKTIAVVGSRRCSFYGMNMSKKLAYDLAQEGITVVSGLARGIDTAAHKGTLKAKGETIAVLGHGFRKIYPPEAGPLMHEICEVGAVITEYTSKVEPLKGNFPRRNRIISGLSHGVVVVEAGHKSGAMITANIALEQGREVFAVPGRADTAGSKGANYLIQNGAKLVMGIDDITEELGPIEKKNDIKQKNVYESNENKFPTDPENKIFNILSGENICLHIDDIAEKSEMQYSELSEFLLKMECSGAIRALAGRRFILKK